MMSVTPSEPFPDGHLLRVADIVFATKGGSASIEDIAHHGGMPTSVLTRRFPTHAALLQAVFVEKIRRLTREAEKLQHAADPTSAFFAFFNHVAWHAVTNEALRDLLVGDIEIDTNGAISGSLTDLLRAMDKLLARAQRAGTVRDDVRVNDLIPFTLTTFLHTDEAARGLDTLTRRLETLYSGLCVAPAG